MPSLQSLLPLLQAFSSSSGFYATNGIFIRRLVDGKRYTDIHTSTIRVSDQYQKVLPRANIDFRISRGDSRFWGNDFEPSQGKTPQSTESLPGNPRKWESNSQGTKQTDWEVIIHSNSSPSGTPPLSPSSTSADSEINLSQLFRGESGNFGGGKERTVMVERKFNSLQREIFNFFPTTNNNKLRCITTGLGSELSRTDNRRAMVHGGTQVSHKCLGAQGSQISYNVLHIKRTGCNISSHPHGQHGSPIILNENGGYQKPGVDCDQQGNLAIPFEAKDNDYCRILTRVNECRGRQGIQANQGFKRMETKPNNLHEIVSDKGNSRGGFVCLEGITPITPLHILENRSFQSGQGCFSDILGSQVCVCFSPFCTHRKGSSESKSGSVSNAHNNPSMARSTMVSRAFKNVCKKSTAFASTQRSTERSCRKVESTRNTEFTATSGLDNLRQNLLAEGISERASNLITNNRRTSSIKHYESAWKKWCGWCSEREISPTRSNINYVLDFLAELFEKGLEYRTIGTHRSAISAFHDPIENIRVGNHPRVSALMSGIFNKRPPQPKYPFIWDVETVLDFLRKLPGNDLLSDKLLTLKVSMLLSLLSASRVSEIINLRVDYLTKHSSVYTFVTPHLTKTCRRGKKPHPNLKFYNFPGDNKLCVCKAIDSYLERRNAWGLGNTSFSSVILNHINQCHCQQSLGGWDKFKFKTEVFKAQSINIIFKG